MDHFYHFCQAFGGGGMAFLPPPLQPPMTYSLKVSFPNLFCFHYFILCLRVSNKTFLFIAIAINKYISCFKVLKTKLPYLLVLCLHLVSTDFIICSLETFDSLEVIAFLKGGHAFLFISLYKCRFTPKVPLQAGSENLTKW